MSPQFQSRLGPSGNCLAACLATLIDMPISGIPDFILAEDPPNKKPEDYPQWYLQMQTFLNHWGFQLIEFHLHDRPWMPIPFETWGIFTGRMESGVAHSIVGKMIDGHFEPYFDPAGNETVPFKTIETVCILVPTDPGKYIRREMALRKIVPLTDSIENPFIRNAVMQCIAEGLDEDPGESRPRIIFPNGKS